MPLKNRMIILGLVILTVISTALLLSMRLSSSMKLPAVDSTVEATEPDIASGQTSTDPQLLTMVSVSNPFGISNSDVKFMVPKDESDNTIYSVAFYTNTTNKLMLPKTFVGTGVDMSPITSGQTIAIMQYITFTNNAAIVWDTRGDANPNHVWTAHPEQIMVKAGQSASLMYVSKDHGVHWEGSIKIVTLAQ